MVYALLALCIIPVLVFFVCLALLVQGFKKTKGLWACLLGLLAVIPCALLETFFIHSSYVSLVALLFEMLLGALIEETGKALMLFCVPSRRSSLLAFMSYSMLCGFTLGCFETLVYILTGEINAGGPGFLSRLPAMLIHLACTGLAGLTVFSVRKKYAGFLPFLFAVLFHGVYNYFGRFDDFRRCFAYVVVLIALFECRIQYANLKSRFEELSLVETDKIIKGDVDRMSEEKKSLWSKVKGLFAKKEEPAVAPATPEQTVFGSPLEETIVDKPVETSHETAEPAAAPSYAPVEENRDSLSFKSNYPRIDNLFNDDHDLGSSISDTLSTPSVSLSEPAEEEKKPEVKKPVGRPKSTAAKTGTTAKKTTAAKTTDTAKKTVKKTAAKSAETATKTAKTSKTAAEKATATAKKTTKAAAEKKTTAKTTTAKTTTAKTTKAAAEKKTTAAKTTKAAAEKATATAKKAAGTAAKTTAKAATTAAKATAKAAGTVAKTAKTTAAKAGTAVKKTTKAAAEKATAAKKTATAKKTTAAEAKKSEK